MRVSTFGLAASLAVLVAAGPGTVQDNDWSFTGIDRIELEGVSGDLIVERGSGDALELSLRADVRPSGAFTPDVRQDGATLWIEEDWGHGSSSGSVEWTLSIPESMTPTVVMDTASGDIEVSGVEARLDFDSASGDVRLRSATIRDGSSFDTASGDLDLRDVVVQGDVDMDTASGDVSLVGVEADGSFRFETASGDVDLERTRGVLRGSSASGDVSLRDVQLDGPSRFSSASGDVVVRLSEPLRYDLEASSASGDVRLEAPFGSDFTLVMTHREDRGSIHSPFSDATERTFERNGYRYREVRVQQGSGEPEIQLKTASGSVEVRRQS